MRALHPGPQRSAPRANRDPACHDLQFPDDDAAIKALHVAPTQVLLMQVLSSPGSYRPTILVGTASDIPRAEANPGVDTVSPRGWLQATVVPDGVARVVMHFTPPVLRHYTVSMAIHGDVGIVIRKADYSPTTVLWYAADGHLMRKCVDWMALRYDNCLAMHKHKC